MENTRCVSIGRFNKNPHKAGAALMDTIEDRKGKTFIITSEIPVSIWHDVNGEKTVRMQSLTVSYMKHIDLI